MQKTIAACQGTYFPDTQVKLLRVEDNIPSFKWAVICDGKSAL